MCPVLGHSKYHECQPRILTSPEYLALCPAGAEGSGSPSVGMARSPGSATPSEAEGGGCDPEACAVGCSAQCSQGGSLCRHQDSGRCLCSRVGCGPTMARFHLRISLLQWVALYNFDVVGIFKAEKQCLRGFVSGLRCRKGHKSDKCRTSCES